MPNNQIVDISNAGSTTGFNFLLESLKKTTKRGAQQKKKLILDLDGTLVAVFRSQPKVQHSAVSVEKGRSKATLYVAPRKSLVRFLQTLNEHYEIQIFTSAVQEVLLSPGSFIDIIGFRLLKRF